MDVGDIVAGIRRLRGVPEAAPRVGVNLDPDVVRYLDSLGTSGAQAVDGSFHPGQWPVGVERWAESPVVAAARSMDSGAPAAPDMSLGSPLWHQADKSARAYDNLAKGRTANLRNQNPDFVRIAQANIADANRAASAGGMKAGDLADVAIPAAAGTALVGAAMLPSTNQPKKAVAAPKKESSTADLAEESRPVPAVAATDADGVPTDEAAFTDMFKRQYLAREAKREEQGKGGYANKPQPEASPSDRAKAILADLNARRRKAGGEVPEATQMMDEANRLLAQGNAARNAPSYKPAPASNPREQAQAIIQKLNAMRMEAGGEVPQSRQMLAEARRLQEMADAQDWR